MNTYKMSRQERLNAAVIELIGRIALGQEYPDTEWRCTQTFNVTANELCAEYDARFATE